LLAFPRGAWETPPCSRPRSAWARHRLHDAERPIGVPTRSVAFPRGAWRSHAERGNEGNSARAHALPGRGTAPRRGVSRWRSHAERGKLCSRPRSAWARHRPQDAERPAGVPTRSVAFPRGAWERGLIMCLKPAATPAKRLARPDGAAAPGFLPGSPGGSGRSGPNPLARSRNG